MYRYRPDVLAQLLEHGLSPRPTTPPERVHELLSDLYRFELRRMRSRLVSGEFAKTEYFARIVELRRQYPLVSLKPSQFIE